MTKPKIKSKPASRLLAEYPHLVKEWHKTKNGQLTPSDVAHRSHKKVWWQCPKIKEHEWQASAAHRSNGGGCVFCAGRRVNKLNSFAAIHPDLVAQWHPTLNGTLKPTDITAGSSSKKIWWQCDKAQDHIWQVAASQRNTGYGCPFCSGRKTDKRRSLSAVYPQLARQWHKTKNGDLKPADVGGRSSKKVWWQCPKVKDHEWQTTILNRALGGGCPFCSHQRVHQSNSLSTIYPKLAKEWHKTKNQDLNPGNVTCGSSKKVWWQCAKNAKHEWQAIVLSRSLRGDGCPYCVNYKVLPDSSFAAVFPALVREWDKTRNGDLDPYSIAPHTNILVWWKCSRDNDHVWKSSVGKRTSKTRSGCPYCANRKVDAKNSLLAVNPLVAQQWHKKLNGKLKPSDVTSGSNKKVWWRCLASTGHVWQAMVANVVKSRLERLTTGCPFCALAEKRLFAKLQGPKPVSSKTK